MFEEYDFIVVGAGSAGCVIASRLSANKDVSVLLLEAGGPANDSRIRTPAKFGALINTQYDWGFRTAPQTELHNRQIYFPRGRAVGGTGSINYMIYLRGHPSDFDYWRQLGCEGWSWQDVLPYFKRSEGNRTKTDSLHGTDGPLVVDTQSQRNDLSEMFLSACQETGLAFNPDLNGAEIEGCGVFPATLKNNERCSSAASYLDSAVGRTNLTIVTGATVMRIAVESGRAVGVDYLERGQSKKARAGLQTVLCAGAIGSPHLLQISGIGPPDLLKSASVEVVHALAGVGENLQDHLHYRSRWEITKPLTLFGRSPEETAEIQRQYDTQRSGPLTTNHYESGAFLSSRDGLSAPDIELLMIPFFLSMEAPEMRPPDRHGITVSGFPTRPQSRGRVTITSGDPLDRPVIDPCYLSEPEDLQLMVRMIRETRDIIGARAFDTVRGPEITPGAAKQSDAELIDAIRSNASTSFHPVGSCKMGVDEMAVVDPKLRVHGLDGLCIADASVMPSMNTGHPNAPTIMIAEKAADLLLEL